MINKADVTFLDIPAADVEKYLGMPWVDLISALEAGEGDVKAIVDLDDKGHPRFWGAKPGRAILRKGAGPLLGGKWTLFSVSA